MPRGLATTALAVITVASSACGSVTERASWAGASTSKPVVPDVVGLTEGEAARSLDESGLVANVRYVDGAPREGTVFRSDPVAGSELSDHSVVVLYLSHPPRLPMPRPEQESEASLLGRIVTRNPDVFVGLYRAREGALHVVFGPGADPADWIERLNEAARPITYPEPRIGYRIDTCPRSYRSLRPLQDEIAEDQSWHDDENLAFGVWVDPQTCTVRVETDLIDDDGIAALVERYGGAVSFNTTPGSHPRALLDASEVDR
jgi:hypothetical protein